MQVHVLQAPLASMPAAAAAPPLRLATLQLNPQGLQRARRLTQARPRLHPTLIHPCRHPLPLLEARHHLRATRLPAQVSLMALASAYREWKSWPTPGAC